MRHALAGFLLYFVMRYTTAVLCETWCSTLPLLTGNVNSSTLLVFVFRLFASPSLLSAMAAAIASLVRELRQELQPGEHEHVRAAASWPIGAGFQQKSDFEFADLQNAVGFKRLHEAAASLLKRVCIQQTAAAVTSAPVAGVPKRCSGAGSGAVASGVNAVIALTSSKKTVEHLQGSDKGPREAIRLLLCGMEPGNIECWRERARLDALCGSSQRSLREVASAVRCWVAFAEPVLGLSGAACMPPPVDGLVQWSRVFAVKNTFRNYLGKLRLACEILRLPTCNLDHPSVKRAKATILALSTAPKAKHSVRCNVVAQLVQLARSEGDTASSLLYVLAYAFLLRVPSELLPVTLGFNGVIAPDKLPVGVHSCLSIENNCVRLQLARRKHKPHGSTMRRGCWCKSCEHTCPVHVLGPLLRRPEGGGRTPFAFLTPERVNMDLRRRLLQLGIKDSAEYDTRCFRRGHAEDLAHNSSRLHEILAAGEWSSSRFQEYLNMEVLEDAVVMKAHGSDELSSDCE